MSVGSITAGKLVFTPAANANGSPEASFTFQVQDDGGTGNGGVDLDQRSKKHTTELHTRDDPLCRADTTKNTSEDTAYTFTAANFALTDPNDSPANNLLAVKITTLPSAGSGTLTDNGVAVISFLYVTVTTKTYTLSLHDALPISNGSPEASFTFQVQDDGGTGNGGVDLDQ